MSTGTPRDPDSFGSCVGKRNGKGRQLAQGSQTPWILGVEKLEGVKSEAKWAEIALAKGLFARWALQELRTLCFPHIILKTPCKVWSYFIGEESGFQEVKPLAPGCTARKRQVCLTIAWP